jgi:putative ABC transport system permease protein
MFKNYLKIAIRNILKHKVYSLINVFGLAIGMACSILILLWVRDELSYDRFHKNAERVYRVTREWKNQDGRTSLHLARVAPPIGPLLKNDFPGIVEDVVRIRADFNTLLKLDDRTFVEDNFFWAEENIFNIFSIPLLEGDPATALKEPNSVVLTEAMGRKYFGEEDPLGKTINYEGEADLKVTGVVKNVPENSHFNFDFLGSFITLENFFGKEFMTSNWGRNNYLTYLLLPEGLSPDVLREQIPGFLDNHITQLVIDNTGQPPTNKPSLTNQLHLQKLTDIHLHSHLTTEIEQNGDIVNVYLFSAIAFFILLIACINFMNLATARSAKRAREIGMRKVLGAYRKQLIGQFLGESLLIAGLALIIAVSVVEATLPYFNDFVGKHLSLAVWQNPEMIAGLIAITLFVGLLSGSYPAFLLSSFRPVRVLKGEDKSSGKSTFRRVLVVSQFTISIALIISMGIVYQQLDFLRHKKLGFNKEQVVILQANGDMQENFETIKSRLMQNASILNVSASRLIPSNKLLNSWGGQVLESNETVPLSFRLAVVEVNYNFFDTYNIQLLTGRDFSREYATDDSAAFVLNRAAVEKLGWTVEETVNKSMLYGNRNGRVIGVVEDIHFESLHNKIVPIIYLINKQGSYQFSLRISGQNIPGTLAFIKNIWTEYQPDYPFEYSFLDERLNALYNSEENLGNIFSIFSFLAVIIACLGLYGLAAYSAEQRTKEIGIRKVLGASVGKLIGLLSKEFLELVIIANVIAWPLAWYPMNKWLEEFAYRINIAWWVFALAGGLALIIALLTVSYQAIRTALSNPVKALRYE